MSAPSQPTASGSDYVDPRLAVDAELRNSGSPELTVALDMVRRSLPFIPLLVIGAAAIWGTDGAWSTAYGIAVVLANFVLAALILKWTAKISVVMLAMGAFGGFAIRLALIFAAVMLVRDAGWVDLVPLGLTLIVTHLGLLFWELRYVSATLAHPDLKPSHSPVSAD